MAQEARMLSIGMRLTRGMARVVDQIGGSHCTIRVVASEAVNQGFDWVKLSPSLRKVQGEQVH